MEFENCCPGGWGSFKFINIITKIKIILNYFIFESKKNGGYPLKGRNEGINIKTIFVSAKPTKIVDNFNFSR